MLRAIFIYLPRLHHMQRTAMRDLARRWWTCQTSQATLTIVTTLSAASEIFCMRAATDPYFIVAPSPALHAESCRLIASSQQCNYYYTTRQHPVLSARPRKMKEKYFANGLMGCCCSFLMRQKSKEISSSFWWMTSKRNSSFFIHFALYRKMKITWWAYFDGNTFPGKK